MHGAAMMNQTPQAWIEITASKECSAASGQVFATLTPAEKEAAKTTMGYRRQTEPTRFYVMDNAIARRMFAGFWTETNKTF